MSKKSSSFKRKLKTRKFGFRYYRIWGNPLKPYNVEYHKGKRDGKVVFKFEDTYILLYAEPGFVGMRNSPIWKQGKYVSSLTPYEKSFRNCINGMLNGSITPHSYFRTMAQAKRELAMYASGCKTEGLDSLISFHEEMDAFDRLWENQSSESASSN